MPHKVHVGLCNLMVCLFNLLSTLFSDEVITEVSGRAASQINDIRFTTNIGQNISIEEISHGGGDGTIFGPFRSSVEGGYLAYISGLAGTATSLTFVFMSGKSVCIWSKFCLFEW